MDELNTESCNCGETCSCEEKTSEPLVDNYIKGQYTYGDPQIIWGADSGGGQVIIGGFCSVDSTATFLVGGNHRHDWISTFPFMAWPDEFPPAKEITGHPSTKGDVQIGNDVWIGRSAFILSGVEIADGCVIGAFAVVAKSILEPYSVIVGNPGRIVKKRFSDEQIAALMQIRWWGWPIEKIVENAPLLCSDNIDLFIEKHLGNG